MIQQKNKPRSEMTPEEKTAANRVLHFKKKETKRLKKL